MSKKKCCDKKIPSHEKELTRLKKIAGQVGGIEKMIVDERYCIDILQQLSAVKAAVTALQANILETHIASCVKDVFQFGEQKEVDEKIEELKKVFGKY